MRGTSSRAIANLKKEGGCAGGASQPIEDIECHETVSEAGHGKDTTWLELGEIDRWFLHEFASTSAPSWNAGRCHAVFFPRENHRRNMGPLGHQVLGEA